jgi:hypothetical protein
MLKFRIKIFNKASKLINEYTILYIIYLFFIIKIKKKHLLLIFYFIFKDKYIINKENFICLKLNILISMII